ncbi:hypothetical protein QQS21_008697 [Conoideocrella luteorostrata]|uniref:Uncharacterized protein n=1 Tax=Conoideocrella luteorostrata TaxID=1105319 RepID=A0AAJ0FVR6_9HYPO|nr:hypothetical protein QQS21_008697 [Conoideocrella luteorostrata]
MENSFPNAMKNWEHLPPEIRLMILEATTEQKSPGWSSLASVCKEWQAFIEKKNFRSLRLQVPCLDEFQRIVIRQRKLVQHIQLDIEGGPYARWNKPSPMCSIIEQATRKLSSILSTLEPDISLTVELNRHASDDDSHMVKLIYFSSDDGETSTHGVEGINSRWHDPGLIWFDELTIPGYIITLGLIEKKLPKGFLPKLRRNERYWIPAIPSPAHLPDSAAYHE